MFLNPDRRPKRACRPLFIILLAISTKQEHLPISNSDIHLRPKEIRFRRSAEIYDLKHVIFAIKYGEKR